MKRIITVSLIILLSISIFSQERTHIPYSVYGIGKIMPKGFGRNMAMGRSGIALSSARYLNNMNPASYHSIDSISFFFDFGISSDLVKYKTSRDGSQNGNDVNIRGIALGFRASRNWSMCFGVRPFSSVGYRIDTRNEIEGTPDQFYTAKLSGSGGLNQLYWDNSYLLFNRLSLGVSLNYLFGKTDARETISAGSLSDEINIDQTSYMHKVYADFGLQYLMPFKEDWNLTLGAIFGNSHKLNIEDRYTLSETDGTVIEDEVTNTGQFDFPMYVGAGIAAVYKNSLTLTADYTYQDWSGNSSDNNENFRFHNNHSVHIGAELIPGRYAQLGYFGSVAYRAGAYYDQSYLELSKKSFSDKGFTFGLGFPFLQNRTSINISYNYGVNGALENGLIKERYHSFMFNLTMHDWWFIKRKID